MCQLRKELRGFHLVSVRLCSISRESCEYVMELVCKLVEDGRTGVVTLEKAQLCLLASSGFSSFIDPFYCHLNAPLACTIISTL